MEILLFVTAKTYADITDVYMGLKVKTETDADDMFLSKVSPAGVTFDEPTHTFTMLLDQVDTEETGTQNLRISYWGADVWAFKKNRVIYSRS